MNINIEFPSCKYLELQKHLLFNDPENEQAGFVFARQVSNSSGHNFEYVDMYLVPSDGFTYQSGYYIELSDLTKSKIIKQAHDSNLCLIEFHSHLGSRPAEFSTSDLSGFVEFVPHVRWRLKGKPYLAIVMSEKTFDAFVWMEKNKMPHILNGIKYGSKIIKPTNLSMRRYQSYE